MSMSYLSSGWAFLLRCFHVATTAFVFLSRLVSAAVVNSTIFLSIIGSIVILLGLVSWVYVTVIDFIAPSEAGMSESSEFLSKSLEFLLVLVGRVFEIIGSFLVNVSDMKTAQVLLLLILVMSFSGFIFEKGVQGATNLFSLIFRNMVARTVWAFNTIGLYQSHVDFEWSETIKEVSGFDSNVESE